jgi:hypothetical protein
LEEFKKKQQQQTDRNGALSFEVAVITPTLPANSSSTWYEFWISQFMLKSFITDHRSNPKTTQNNNSSSSSKGNSGNTTHSQLGVDQKARVLNLSVFPQLSPGSSTKQSNGNFIIESCSPLIFRQETTATKKDLKGFTPRKSALLRVFNYLS